jgi:hypothetical protein
MLEDDSVLEWMGSPILRRMLAKLQGCEWGKKTHMVMVCASVKLKFLAIHFEINFSSGIGYSI